MCVWQLAQLFCVLGGFLWRGDEDAPSDGGGDSGGQSSGGDGGANGAAKATASTGLGERLIVLLQVR